MEERNKKKLPELLSAEKREINWSGRFLDTTLSHSSTWK